MVESTKRSVVVTGASTGLGFATARHLLKNGWRVFGSVRKGEDADRLRRAFGPDFTPLIFDVTDDAGVAAGASHVRQALEGRTLSGLINNAGVAVSGPLRYLPIEEMRFQFEVNVFGVLRVTQAFLPLLGPDKSLAGAPGKIINVGSVFGKISAPIFGPYAMSKHAIEAYSDALRRELMMHGVDVVNIAPGAVKTPIWEKADSVDVEQYRDTEYYETLQKIQSAAKGIAEAGLESEHIARLMLEVLLNPKPKPRYAAVKNPLMNWHLPRLLPRRALDRAQAKRMGLPSSSP